MVDVLQLATNATVLSAFYALIAVGFTMIFGVADILNIAHGAAIIVGGFTAYYTTRVMELDSWTGGMAAVVLGAAFSVLVYKMFVKRVEHDEILVVIVTLALLLLTEYTFRSLAGSSTHLIPGLIDGRTHVGSVGIQNNEIIMFVLSWILIIALLLLVNRTWTGRGIKAMSQTKRGAALVGIDHERTTTYTYAIAGALAGLAGLFFGIRQGVTFDMGLDPLLIAFAIVIIGGIGSIKGSVVGAYIVGSLETITTTVIDARLTGVIALAVLLIVLLVKPHGLYGRPGEE
ncbi:branched-chain amino acid ABC transporter permease [Natrialbaceae archaeon GCM10025810]|uniref:branched-chain amino acid ABC transporter permease n=1 Tax=Halovalidus salilacus TaxID=3075124 RepID=UPI003610D763